MTGRLAGKSAVITGAASGIGAGTARLFVEEGAQVIVADMQVDAGRALVAELGDAARFAEVNVLDEAQVAAAVDLAVAEFGTLDIMFNNAGIVGAVGRISEMPVEAWDNTIAILLRGVFLGVKHAARVMMPQNSGVIISTASTAGVLGGLGPHAYTAAKHALVGLTRQLSQDLGPFGITCNAIAPGFVRSNPTTERQWQSYGEDGQARLIAGIHTRRLGTAEDIAHAVLFLASEQASWISGQILSVDGGRS